MYSWGDAMPITMTWDEVEKDSDEALRRAESATIFIEEDAVATHVLLSAEEYRKICGESDNALGG
jgi:hypothetical protein